MDYTVRILSVKKDGIIKWYDIVTQKIHNSNVYYDKVNKCYYCIMRNIFLMSEIKKVIETETPLQKCNVTLKFGVC